MLISIKEISKIIDHSLLKPELSEEQVREGCRIAKEYDTATVCVKPSDVIIASEELKGTDVLVSTVIGFPHGSNKTEIKVFESIQGIEDGAVELDMVLNIGRLLSDDFEYVKNDIKAVVETAHTRNAIVKVILENAYLNDKYKEIACRLCEEAGADFVKTSTGYGPSGATVEDVRLMRRTLSPNVKVKAAGGIRTLSALLAFKEAGADRIGATATKAILDEAKLRFG